MAALAGGFTQELDDSPLEVAAIHESAAVAEYQEPTPQTVPIIYLSGSQLIIRNFTVAKWIAAAYDVPEFMVSGPGWITSEKYDLFAKAPRGATRRRIPLMLQPLMAERFALQIHKEAKVSEGYALVLGKSGSKLQPSAGFDAEPAVSLTTPKSAPTKPVYHYRNYPMPLIAKNLSVWLGESTIDATGLPGSYDFEITYSLTEYLMRHIKKDNEAEVPPTLAESLGALGLKLERRKVPVEQIVVDRVTRPTANCARARQQASRLRAVALRATRQEGFLSARRSFCPQGLYGIY
ncbi:MAG TPA: TIGR03435 family protein [Candidatus Limnocylindrales bacterium]|nr:TIGR03435 family protein [Candidatus Limnocylindrales bacterium]